MKIINTKRKYSDQDLREILFGSKSSEKEKIYAKLELMRRTHVNGSEISEEIRKIKV